MSADTNNANGKSGYLVYLFSVDNNSIVCGIDSTGGLDSEGKEFRTSCNCHTLKKLDHNVLEHMDRGVGEIDSWKKFYAWLGGGHGWAFFPIDNASVFASHWLSSDFKISCHRLEDEDGNPIRGCPFVDASMSATDLSTKEEMLDAWNEMAGQADEIGEFHRFQMEDNMFITKQPLFIC